MASKWQKLSTSPRDVGRLLYYDAYRQRKSLRGEERFHSKKNQVSFVSTFPR